MSGTGVNDYTIGSSIYQYRPKGLSELFVGGTTEDKRHSIVDFQTFKNLYSRNNSEKLVYEWYDAANDLWKVHINPAPSDTIYYSYFWIPAKKTSSSDSVVTMSIEALARFSLAEIYDTEDEFEKAAEQRNIAEQIVSDEIAWENTPAVGQLYSMGSLTNSVKTRGIGSY